MSPHPKPGGPRRRKPLSHQGGPTLVAGDPGLARVLARAMDVGSLPPDRLTHGFHSYPARMHWAIAQRALEGLSPRGARVLDPFCGAGTVLVEARAQGLSGGGSDLNPLALALAALKCDPRDAAGRARLVHTAGEVAARSEARVRAREPAHAPLSPEQCRWYGPHTLKELAGLLEEIDAVEAEADRSALRLVFSALCVKFSSQRADTAEQSVERRIRKGLPTEFFLRKTRELSERWEALEPLATGPAPRLFECDARRVHTHLAKPVDLVLTSPPYGGTYDYVRHHRLRFAWLGMEDRDFARDEIGARRHHDDLKRFAQELGQALSAVRRCLEREGLAVLLMGDSEHGGERQAADRLVEDLAGPAGFAPLAIASQPRPDFRGGAPRAEHLMLLEAR